MDDFRLCRCGDELHFSEHCGAFVCDRCDAHLGLVRCFCGWSASGMNGRQELEDYGEIIYEEEY